MDIRTKSPSGPNFHKIWCLIVERLFIQGSSKIGFDHERLVFWSPGWGKASCRECIYVQCSVMRGLQEIPDETNPDGALKLLWLCQTGHGGVSREGMHTCPMYLYIVYI